MNSDKTYWIDKNDRNLQSDNHSSLIQVKANTDNKELSSMLTINNEENVSFKGAICYGRKPNTKDNISQKEQLEKWNQKYLQQILQDYKDRDFREETAAQRVYENFD